MKFIPAILEFLQARRVARLISEPTMLMHAPNRVIDGVDIKNVELAQLISDAGSSMRDFLGSLLAVGIFTVLARSNPAITNITMGIAVLCLLTVWFRQIFVGVSIGNLYRERKRVRRAIIALAFTLIAVEATITVHLWSNLPRLYGAQEERLKAQT